MIGVFFFLNLVHDCLKMFDMLQDGIVSDRLLEADLPQSVHNKYQSYLFKENITAKYSSFALSTLRACQLVLEITAYQRSFFTSNSVSTAPGTRWKTVILIEILKAAIKLNLLNSTNQMILTNPFPKREHDPNTIHELISSIKAFQPKSSTSHSTNDYSEQLQDPNTDFNKHRTSFMHIGDVDAYLQRKALHDPRTTPLQSLPNLTSSKWCAEIIHIIRPVIYCNTKKILESGMTYAIYQIDLINNISLCCYFFFFWIF